MNEGPSGQAPLVPPPPDDPGVDTLSQLLRGTGTLVRQRALGMLLVALGSCAAAVILTVGVIAAAWDTPWRWTVLLGMAGLHLVLGGIGLWMLRRPVESPDLDAVQEKMLHLQQQARRFSASLRQAGEAPATLAGIVPRSRTLRWVASLRTLPVPWVGVVRLLLGWRATRRR